jgi:hypothetical protein
MRERKAGRPIYSLRNQERGLEVSFDLKKCISYRSRENRFGPDLKNGCRDKVRLIGLCRDRTYIGEK